MDDHQYFLSGTNQRADPHRMEGDNGKSAAHKRNIVLGIVNTAGMKCTNINRKRRWDQTPEELDVTTTKKLCINDVESPSSLIVGDKSAEIISADDCNSLVQPSESDNLTFNSIKIDIKRSDSNLVVIDSVTGISSSEIPSNLNDGSPERTLNITSSDVVEAEGEEIIIDSTVDLIDTDLCRTNNNNSPDSGVVFTNEANNKLTINADSVSTREINRIEARTFVSSMSDSLKQIQFYDGGDSNTDSEDFDKLTERDEVLSDLTKSELTEDVVTLKCDHVDIDKEHKTDTICAVDESVIEISSSPQRSHEPNAIVGGTSINRIVTPEFRDENGTHQQHIDREITLQDTIKPSQDMNETIDRNSKDTTHTIVLDEEEERAALEGQPSSSSALQNDYQINIEELNNKELNINILQDEIDSPTEHLLLLSPDASSSELKEEDQKPGGTANHVQEEDINSECRLEQHQERTFYFEHQDEKKSVEQVSDKGAHLPDLNNISSPKVLSEEQHDTSMPFKSNRSDVLNNKLVNKSVDDAVTSAYIPSKDLSVKSDTDSLSGPMEIEVAKGTVNSLNREDPTDDSIGSREVDGNTSIEVTSTTSVDPAVMQVIFGANGKVDNEVNTLDELFEKDILEEVDDVYTNEITLKKEENELGAKEKDELPNVEREILEELSSKQNPESVEGENPYEVVYMEAELGALERQVDVPSEEELLLECNINDERNHQELNSVLMADKITEEIELPDNELKYSSIEKEDSTYEVGACGLVSSKDSGNDEKPVDNSENIKMKEEIVELNDLTEEIEISKPEEKDNASKNLDETEVQTHNISKNLDETEVQKENASKNLDETEVQEDNLIKNLEESEVQGGNASGNLDETEVRKENTSKNLDETEVQEDNVSKNLDESEIQGGNASENLGETEVQKENTSKNVDETEVQEDNLSKNLDETEVQKDNVSKNLDETEVRKENTSNNLEETEVQKDNETPEIDSSGLFKLESVVESLDASPRRDIVETQEMEESLAVKSIIEAPYIAVFDDDEKDEQDIKVSKETEVGVEMEINIEESNGSSNVERNAGYLQAMEDSLAVASIVDAQDVEIYEQRLDAADSREVGLFEEKISALDSNSVDNTSDLKQQTIGPGDVNNSKEVSQEEDRYSREKESLDNLEEVRSTEELVENVNINDQTTKTEVEDAFTQDTTETTIEENAQFSGNDEVLETSSGKMENIVINPADADHTNEAAAIHLPESQESNNQIFIQQEEDELKMEVIIEATEDSIKREELKKSEFVLEMEVTSETEVIDDIASTSKNDNYQEPSSDDQEVMGSTVLGDIAESQDNSIGQLLLDSSVMESSKSLDYSLEKEESMQRDSEVETLPESQTLVITKVRSLNEAKEGVTEEDIADSQSGNESQILKIGTTDEERSLAVENVQGTGEFQQPDKHLEQNVGELGTTNLITEHRLKEKSLTTEIVENQQEVVADQVVIEEQILVEKEPTEKEEIGGNKRATRAICPSMENALNDKQVSSLKDSLKEDILKGTVHEEDDDVVLIDEVPAKSQIQQDIIHVQEGDELTKEKTDENVKKKLDEDIIQRLEDESAITDDDIDESIQVQDDESEVVIECSDPVMENEPMEIDRDISVKMDVDVEPVPKSHITLHDDSDDSVQIIEEVISNSERNIRGKIYESNKGAASILQEVVVSKEDCKRQNAKLDTHKEGKEIPLLSININQTEQIKNLPRGLTIVPLLKTISNEKQQKPEEDIKRIQNTHANELQKQEPITLRIYKDNLTIRTDGLDSPKKNRSPVLGGELKSQLSPHLRSTTSPGKGSLSPQTKQLEFTLKIAKDANTNFPKATMSPKSNMSTSGSIWKSDVTSSLVNKEIHSPGYASPTSETTLSKLKLKLCKPSDSIEIIAQHTNSPTYSNSSVETKQPVPVKCSVESSSGENIAPRSIASTQCSQLEEFRTPKSTLKLETMFKKMLESQDNSGTPLTSSHVINKVEVSTPSTSENSRQLAPALLVTPVPPLIPTPRKRGRPRKIVQPPIHLGQQPSPLDPNSPLQHSFTVPDSGSGAFSLADSLNSNRPMRSCRGRTKPIVVRTRKPRGGGARGGGRGRGITRITPDRETLTEYEKAELAKIEARKEKLRVESIARYEAKKAKKLAKKLKDEERRKRLAREKAEKAEAAAPQVFEEETRMSAPDNSNSRGHTPAPSRTSNQALASLRRDGSKIEPREQALEAVAAWNANLNRERKEERRCALDLQTFTIHYPKNDRESMTRPIPKVGLYPIALIPGQYCDYTKQYTPTELMYLPVNTVLYGPLKPNERHAGGDDDDDGSGSDSDSSSSDDSSDSSSSDSDTTVEKEEVKCKVCRISKKAKESSTELETMIECAQCKGSSHPSCHDFADEMVPHIKKYDWLCTDCKKCLTCNSRGNFEKILCCDLCDRGHHVECLGLKKVPERWHCSVCAFCTVCGSRNPGAPDWHHEYKKGEKEVKIYVRTLCASCCKML